jgi:hypothetical protein
MASVPRSTQSDDDDPLFRLMRRYIQLAEMRPTKVECEDEMHRAMLIIDEIKKIDRAVKSGHPERYYERKRRRLDGGRHRRSERGLRPRAETQPA